MITALLLAVAVAGQVNDEPVAKKAITPHQTIDAAYVPQTNDRAMLGSYDLNAPEEAIGRASCFSSVDRLRKNYEVGGDEYPTDGDVSAAPDGYELRACTPVLVKDRFMMSYTEEGKKMKMGAVKVLILEGEFKGKELYALWFDVIRFEGVQARPAPMTVPARKRDGRRAASLAMAIGDAKLVLTDLTSNPYLSSDYLKFDGRVRCTSDTPLKSVKATVSFEDREGKLVRSAFAYCDPGELAPGGIGSFSVLAESDPRYSRIKIEFEEKDKSVPWIDQSGKNAHQ